jgi:hypothetical protein
MGIEFMWEEGEGGEGGGERERWGGEIRKG